MGSGDELVIGRARYRLEFGPGASPGVGTQRPGNASPSDEQEALGTWKLDDPPGDGGRPRPTTQQE
jgi:hypothetical protein